MKEMSFDVGIGMWDQSFAQGYTRNFGSQGILQCLCKHKPGRYIGKLGLGFRSEDLADAKCHHTSGWDDCR